MKQKQSTTFPAARHRFGLSLHHGVGVAIFQPPAHAPAPRALAEHGGMIRPLIYLIGPHLRRGGLRARRTPTAKARKHVAENASDGAGLR
jgi:hypothetical protein